MYKLRFASIDNFNISQKEFLEKYGVSFKTEKTRRAFTSDFLFYVNSDSPNIKINTLEELQKFVEVIGPIVLDEDEILVYNDYIE